MNISKALLNTIADNMEAGEKCFIHKISQEIICFPEDCDMELDPEINIWLDDMEKTESDENFIEIEKMKSHEYFDVMEEFANSITDHSAKILLLTALDGKKPFANFKYQIDNLGDLRDRWFIFRRQKNIESIAYQLSQIDETM